MLFVRTTIDLSPVRTMSATKSAMQRVLEMPEMLLPIFLELDVPDQFARVNRLFRETSMNYVNIAKHFEYRFYPFEIMAQFLPRVKLHKERLDLLAVRNDQMHA